MVLRGAPGVMDWVCATPGGLCGRQIQNDLAFDGFKRAVHLFTHEPVVKRHLMVSGSLVLLLCCFEVAEGSRAAAPRGEKVL